MSRKFLTDFEDAFEGLGFPGTEAITLSSVVFPEVSKAAKPIVKAVIKGDIVLYEKPNKGAISRISKTWKGFVTEGRSGLAKEQKKLVRSTVRIFKIK